MHGVWPELSIKPQEQSVKGVFMLRRVERLGIWHPFLLFDDLSVWTPFRHVSLVVHSADNENLRRDSDIFLTF